MLLVRCMPAMAEAEKRTAGHESDSQVVVLQDPWRSKT
jgi:hypothetical protein